MNQFRGGVLKSKRKIVSVILSVLCAAVLFCGFFAVKNTSQTQSADALTSSTVNSATKIGNGEDLWDSAGNMYNRTVAVDLLEKLFGETQSDGSIKVRDPYEYITDSANYDATEKNTYRTKSTVVSAATINKKLNNTTYGGIVKLGGLDWILASMTLGGYDSETETEGDKPVLVLYLADRLTKPDGSTAATSKFHNVAPNEAGANMYSSSAIRNNIAFLSSNPSSDFYRLSMFNNESAWAQKYLVQPKDVKYEHGVTHVDRGWRSQYYPNEALAAEKFTDKWHSYYGNLYKVSTNTYDGTKSSGGGRIAKYSEWGEDYIWLPCAAEAGWDSSPLNTKSVWKLTVQQLAATNTSWVRSGDYDVRTNATAITTSGGYSCPSTTSVNGVRPAIFLDLEPLLCLVEPQETTRTYNGEAQTLEGEDWYREEIFNDKTLCTVTYKDKDGAIVSPKDVGEYTATFTLKTDDFVWDGSSTSKTRSTKFTIVPKKMQVDFTTDERGVPQLSLAEEPFGEDKVNCVIRYYEKDTGDDKGTDYSALLGKTWYIAHAEFDNPNYVPDPNFAEPIEFLNPATPVNITWLDDEFKKPFTGDSIAFYVNWGNFKDLIDVSYDESVIAYDGWDEFRATNAGKYSVTLSLKNKQDYIWGSQMGSAAGTTNDATIQFEIAPKELELQVVSITPGDWTVTLGGTCDLLIDLPAVPTGKFDVVIYARRTLNSKPIDICAVSLDTTMQSSVPCEFVTDNITSAATYLLGIRVYDESDPNAKNYTFKLDKDYTLTVKEPTSSSGILWRLFEDNKPAGSMQDPATSMNTTWDKKITYNGNGFHFTVNASGMNYTIDTSYNTDGFTNGYRTVKKGNTAALSTVSGAGTYVTTVRLKDNTTSYNYSIEWTIDKAKFDLSNVRWIDDGKISFNENGMKVALVAETIPNGLIPVYGGKHSVTGVGDSGEATVTFTVGDTENYVVPTSGNKDSYIFTADGLDDFEWTKEWTVVPREIPVNWAIGTIVLESGKKINAEVLAGGFDEYVEYVYIETDGNGVPLDGKELSEPQITDNKIRYYKAEARIKGKYEGKYIFDPYATVNLLSPVFEVGRALEAVQLQAKKTEYTYWGSQVKFQYKVTEGAISDNAFDVVYYRGMIRLLAAPTDPGSYRAQVNLKTGFTERYYIEGTNAFDFTIVRGVISVSWNENVKPPVLNLTENQAKYIVYEYRDSVGNTVGISSLRTPGTYGVSARITDTSKYIFDTESTMTEWIEFTVVSGDTVNDPSTSHPDYKPTEDPNGDGGTGTGRTPVRLTLSNPQVYANGSNQPAQFINDANLPSDAFMITYKLNGQVVSEYSAAGYYQIEVKLNPLYEVDYELVSSNFMYIIMPGGGGTPNPNPTPGDGTGNNPTNGTIVSYVPIILSGVSGVLIVVFLIMSLNNLSAAKAAREKTKKLAAMSYSFAPISLLGIVLGLSETNWWIIAGILMGLALIMEIFAFMTKGKKKRALEALGEEEARIAEEKEYARREEMRMMFASMQQNVQQPQFNYEALQGSIQGMISSTMQALLPAIQQVQALPPASPDAAYDKPALSSSSQAEIDRLHEQLAKQQELLNQVLQNQQNVPVYEEEPVDDISWLGESDEMISLEESYGALSDEGKRAYYEIGSYIMNKPGTSQNDGRYAVLFKYRGRTVFKLAIKDDAPVLYYPMGNGRSEVRVYDAASLEMAKSMIDRTVMNVDQM